MAMPSNTPKAGNSRRDSRRPSDESSRLSLAGSAPSGDAKPQAKARPAAELHKGMRPERVAELVQTELFDKATALFQAGKYGLARRNLERVSLGPNASLAHRARVYIDICRQRTARKRPDLASSEDYYNYALQLVNNRKLDEALRVLKRGLSKDSGAADLHYLKAVAMTLADEERAAYLALKKAIALDADIRFIARGDPDLRGLIRREPFAGLIAGST